VVQTNRANTDEDQLREVEANVAVLITEELVAQHELGAHAVPVPECAICRAHARRRDLPLSA
jgi:hypothetical protein